MVWYEDGIKNKDDTKYEDYLKNKDYLKKWRQPEKWRQPQKLMRGGELSSNTMFPAPDTSKSWKWYSSIAIWNYSGLGRVGLGRSNSDYKAISASQQSWSLGLAELGNK